MTQEKPTIRLAKYLAMTGLCSRRAATRYIRDGHITIDGRLANHIDTISLIDSGSGFISQEILKFDDVFIQGIESKQYWMLNKSVGTDCRLLPDDPCSVLHLLPANPRLYPVGRLDKDSRGQLLLTNNGELTQKLMHPDFGHSKTYQVQVDRNFDDSFLINMAQGVSYRDVTTLPCKMTRLDDDKFEIILTQGLNRQIRRMSQALGYKVIDLKRIQIQTLKLGELKEGEMRQLTASELIKLKSALE
ncbi:pseudouridine synthase [Shewanella psychropiezotolerans]|uniref:Dual-specificity RNA pseudouridine synthase RluF n=1 Tax=Shewanella psychropiezotolerans TaxID=2593655 RepID=A0ABX5WU02_9GAMM|nr:MULTISPECIES: pseudouridine synthase [Shewanella]MPY22891.1 pseudouridine synthase [Shewanella sp. YLB-07]QDO82575.1 pseudouridine synthase [Shewanella psychropiezotolerans]